MENMTAQSLRMAVVNAAQTDAAFRDELMKDGASAVTKRFGDQPLKVRVQFEKENEAAILIPQKTEPLARAMERIATDVGDRTPTRSEFEALVIHRAWNDPGFLAELRKDPRAAINKALQKYETAVPREATVRLYEEQAGESLIVISPLPEDSAELSDAELEAVAGGAEAVVLIALGGAIAGAIASKVVDEIWVAPTYPGYTTGGGGFTRGGGGRRIG